MKFRRVPLNRRPFVTLRVCGTFSVQLQAAVSDTWSSISRRKMEAEERDIHIDTSNMTDSVESALDCLLVCCV